MHSCLKHQIKLFRNPRPTKRFLIKRETKRGNFFPETAEVRSLRDTLGQTPQSGAFSNVLRFPGNGKTNGQPKSRKHLLGQRNCSVYARVTRSLLQLNGGGHRKLWVYSRGYSFKSGFTQNVLVTNEECGWWIKGFSKN